VVIQRSMRWVRGSLPAGLMRKCPSVFGLPPWSEYFPVSGTGSAAHRAEDSERIHGRSARAVLRKGALCSVEKDMNPLPGQAQQSFGYATFGFQAESATRLIFVVMSWRKLESPGSAK